MAVTLVDVVRALMPDEGDLSQAVAALGAEALPHLQILVYSPDVMIAARAVHMATLIADSRALPVLAAASARQDKGVRVAVIGAATRLKPDQAAKVLGVLMLDADAEIRQLAVQALPARVAPGLRTRLEMLSLTDPYTHIRELSRGALGHRPPRRSTRSQGKAPAPQRGRRAPGSSPED